MQILEGKLLGLRRTALLEMALFFTLMCSFDFFFGAGYRFIHISPHPFWIIVLLITIQYGTNEGVLAALFSSIFLLVGILPQQAITQNHFEYLIYLIKNPLLWFISAIIIGEIRIKQIRKESSLKEELAMAHEREKTIATSYEGLQKTKESMEVQIVSEMHTATRAYEAFKQLEQMSKEELLMGSYDLVNTLLAPTKFSIFTLKDNTLTCLSYKGWEKEDQYPATYLEHSTLYQCVIPQKRVISVLNADERELLQNEGLIVAPILDPKRGQLFGIIKIEDINFLQVKVTTLETLRLLGEWVGTAYANKVALEEAAKSSMTSTTTTFYSAPFFALQKEFVVRLAKRIQFDVTLLKVHVEEKEGITAVRHLKEAIAKTLRSVDLAFEMGGEKKEFALLLVNTPLKNGEIVLQKIQKQLQESNEGKKHKYGFSLVSLYEKTSDAPYLGAERRKKNKHAVLQESYEFVQTLLNPTKFSIFTHKGDTLECLTNKGWEKEDLFHKKYDAKTPLYKQIAHAKKVISVLEKGERAILQKEGVIAAPIRESTKNELYGMIKIEEIAPSELHKATVDTLTLVGEWVGDTCAKTVAYNEVTTNTSFYPALFFEVQKEYVLKLAQRINFAVSLLTLRVAHKEHTPFIKDAIAESLRPTDIAFEMDEGFSLLLLNTPKESGSVVFNKIKAALQDELPLTYTVHTLYEKR